jgi:hypothetical protein
MTRNWLRSLFSRSSRAVRVRRQPRRLALEALEDRCVPSTLTVTSSADDVTQNHTLRYAVAHAQSGDTIQLTAAIKAPIVLTNGELVVSQNVTIQSVPARTPTISGNGLSRVFAISAGAQVTLDNLTLIGGNGVANNPSGSAGNDGFGGAILNLGSLTVSGSTVSGNSANGNGGGISNPGTLTVTGSAIVNNTAGGNAGGVFNDAGGHLALTNAAISGNTSGYYGGGLSNFGAAAIAGGSIDHNSAARAEGRSTTTTSAGTPPGRWRSPAPRSRTTRRTATAAASTTMAAR